MLRWTLVCTCLFQIWFPLCVCPEVGLLGHMARTSNSIGKLFYSFLAKPSPIWLTSKPALMAPTCITDTGQARVQGGSGQICSHVGNLWVCRSSWRCWVCPGPVSCGLHRVTGAMASAEKIQEPGKRGRGSQHLSLPISVLPAWEGNPCPSSAELSVWAQAQGRLSASQHQLAPRAATCQPGEWARLGLQDTCAPGHIPAACSAHWPPLPGCPVRDVFPVGPSQGRGWRGEVTDSDGALAGPASWHY